MVVTSEYESVYSLKQLENHRMTDDEFYEFCLLNDQIKFERDAFGNIIIMPNTGGITGIKNGDLIIDLGNQPLIPLYSLTYSSIYCLSALIIKTFSFLNSSVQ